MYAIMVKYHNGNMEFFPSCKVAAKQWGCTNQTVLNMLRKCQTRPIHPLANSTIAQKEGIKFIVEIRNFEDLNKVEDGPFVWINGNNKNL